MIGFKNYNYFCSVKNDRKKMKKGFYFLGLAYFALTLLFTFSCNKNISYEDMKNAEKKIIRRILAEKNIEVLQEYPSSGVFGENQFVELPSGIYLHVVDSGNGERAVLYTTDVLVRASGTYYATDEGNFNTFLNTSKPFEFKYGFASRVVNDHSNLYDSYDYYFSIGIESILNYVGDSAVVKLLVPGYSEVGSLSYASTMQGNWGGKTFVPIYYDKVRYVFWR